MDLVILPASGQNFICQLAILQHLCDINYKPSLMLGSSGGNLSAYIVAAADWKSNHVERIARELKSHFFAQPWHNIKLLSHTIGFFNGNAFSTGVGLHDFIKTYFTEESIVKYEIWTGTYNRDLQKFRLFCNRHKNDSLIGHQEIDYNLTQTIEPYFCDGDMDKIADSGLASASIPGLVPPVVIDGYHYTDGASCGSSPASLTQGYILKYMMKHDQPSHITYINSKDLSQAKIMTHHNLFDTWKQAVNDLIKSQTLIDRLITYNLIFNGKDVKHRSFKCEYDELLKIKEERKHLKFSMLEIYPLIECDLDITNFNQDDIVRNLKKIHNQCYCNFWWV